MGLYIILMISILYRNCFSHGLCPSVKSQGRSCNLRHSVKGQDGNGNLHGICKICLNLSCLKYSLTACQSGCIWDSSTHSHISINHGLYIVINYRNYYFYPNEPERTSAPSFVGILKHDERLNCGHTQLLYSKEDWTVVRCLRKI